MNLDKCKPLTFLSQCKRREGTTGAEKGLLYEKLVILWFLLKATLQNIKFSLVTNVEGFGNFDDLVAECEFPDGTIKLICVQIKFKENPEQFKITSHLLQGKKFNKKTETFVLDKSCKYNLHNYYLSIKNKENKDVSGIDVQYVIFINAEIDDADTSLDWEKVDHNNSFYNILNTADNEGVFKLKDISTNFHVMPKVEAEGRTELFSKLLFFTQQWGIDNLTDKIKKLLKKFIPNESNKIVEDIYRKLFSRIDKWSQNSKPISNSDVYTLLIKIKHKIFLSSYKLDSDMEFCYIPRLFNTCKMKKEVFTSLENTDIFFLSTEDISLLNTLTFTLYPHVDNTEKTNIIVFETENTEEAIHAFQVTCTTCRATEGFSKKNLHFLVYKQNEFLWQLTEGSTENLQNFLVPENETAGVTEEDFLKENENKKVNVIVDHAGMGKTTVIKKLTQKLKKIHPESMVAYFNLNATNVTQKLQEMSNLGILNSENAIALLKRTFLLLHTDSEMQHYSNTKFILCFDGFDELCDTYEQLLLSFLKYLLQNDNIQIYLTSRENMRYTLQTSLCTLASSMLPFNDENQKDFLKKYFSNLNQNATEEYVTQFSTELHAALVDMRKSIRDIMGIPLLLHMLAVINNGNFSSFIVSGIINLSVAFTSLTELYDEFIKRHLERYLEEKEGISNNHNKFQERYKAVSEESNEYHKLFAVESLSKQCNIHLSIEDQSKLKEVLTSDEESKTKFGIVSRIYGKENIRFLHLTFAEYFVALYIANYLYILQNLTKKVRKLAIQNFGFILLGKQSIMVRKFIDPLLDDSKVDVSMMLSEVLEYTTKKQSIFLAIREDNYNICQLILTSLPLIKSSALITLRQVLQRKFIDRNRYVNDADIFGKSKLMMAAELNRCNIINLLLHHGADIHHKDGNYRSALMIAAMEGHIEVVSVLLDRGAEINHKDMENWSALTYALSYDHNHVTSLLLDRGADMNDITKSNSTALHVAAMRGNVTALSLLVERGADIHAADSEGVTALMCAANSKKYDCISLLLSHGANIHDVTNDGHTLLFMTCYGFSILNHSDIKKVLQICQLFVEKGVDINKQNKDGETVLHIVIKSHNDETCKFLVEKGIDLNIQNNFGETVLHVAARLENDMFNFLIDNGSNVKIQNTFGDTALHIAARENIIDDCKLLVDSGADINSKNKKGDSALQQAAKRDRYEACKMLLDCGADINLQNEDGETALHIAAYENSIKVCKLLIKYDGELNIQDRYGNTAILAAALKNNIVIYRLLVDHGANVNIMNKSGNTALDEAAKRNFFDSSVFSADSEDFNILQ